MALRILQSSLVSEASFTFVSTREFMWIERDFKGFTFLVSYFYLRQEETRVILVRIHGDGGDGIVTGGRMIQHQRCSRATK